MQENELLQKCHDILDDLNADIAYAACQFCIGENYDGKGLIHNDSCIIITLRRKLEMQVPAIGRIVHYKFVEGEFERPAIIVHCWGKTPESAVQLQVFLDSNEEGQHNDGYNVKPPVSNLVWRTSVMQGNNPGEYHFHEDCQV